jgi:hypothetical protein
MLTVIASEGTGDGSGLAAERTSTFRYMPSVFVVLGAGCFFHILKPKKYGGLGLGEHAKVTMTLARCCASTAWVLSILSPDNAAPVAAADCRAVGAMSPLPDDPRHGQPSCCRIWIAMSGREALQVGQRGPCPGTFSQ